MPNIRRLVNQKKIQIRKMSNEKARFTEFRTGKIESLSMM